MSRSRREQEIEFYCPDDHDNVWMIEGRFNADGKFEPTDSDDTMCADCDSYRSPIDVDIEVA